MSFSLQGGEDLTLDNQSVNLDFQKMHKQIGVLFQQSLEAFRGNDIEKAKFLSAQAYFEVFENFEGPIRINISAHKAYEMEEAFSQIRKKIVAGLSHEVLRASMKKLSDDIAAVIPQLNQHKIVADRPFPSNEGEGESKPTNIPAEWLAKYDYIESQLMKARTQFQLSNYKAAKDLILDANFVGFKNSLLETSIRRFVSARAANDDSIRFKDLLQLMNDKTSLDEVDKRINELLSALNQEIIDLPTLTTNKDNNTFSRQEKVNSEKKDWFAVQKKIHDQLQTALAEHQSGEGKKAISIVQNTYFSIFEESGFEAQLAMQNPQLKADLESKFSLLIAQIKKNRSDAELLSTLRDMDSEITEGVSILNESDSKQSLIALFLLSLTIIVREGFEAILVITAIIGYLLKSDQKEKVKTIKQGAGTAVLTSIILAYSLKSLLNSFSGIAQEVFEGITMVIASIVLFYVSYWIISKAQGQKWQEYIRNEVKKGTETNSLRTLWFLAFLVVFREGAETILFYHALIVKAGASSILIIALGALVGCALLLGVYWLLQKGATRLPLRQFFLLTGTLLFVMSFIFVGQGVLELIQGKLLEATLIHGMPTISSLGIYPYWQTMLPQLCILIAAFSGIIIFFKSKLIVRH
jgi:high-affinity iron transporter